MQPRWPQIENVSVMDNMPKTTVLISPSNILEDLFSTCIEPMKVQCDPIPLTIIATLPGFFAQ